MSFTIPESFQSGAGDCILRSSDGVEFHVVRSVIALASPIFKDMFSLPQGDTQGVQIPTIDMSEDARTLCQLLTVIYPINPPHINDVNEVISLVKAWQKYIMPIERLLPFLNPLFTPDALATHGIWVYAMAWRLGKEDEAKRASRYTHGVELTKELAVNLLQLSGDVGSLVALVQMREERELDMDEIVNLVPLRRNCCSNHGGGDWESNDERAFGLLQAALKRQVRAALADPFPVCRDFMSFLKLDEDWPRGKVPKKCAHPRNDKCFGEIESQESMLVSRQMRELVEQYPQHIEGFL